MMDEPSRLKLQLYNKPISQEVVRQSSVKCFEYRLQRTPVIIYSITALVVSGITVVFYLTQPLDNYFAYLIFGFAVVSVAVLVLYSLYGQHITATAVVAVSKESLYTGTWDALWRIDWSLLKFEDFHFGDVNKYNGKLTLTVANQEIPLYMESNLVEIDELGSLITSLVACTREGNATKELLEDEITDVEMMEG